MPPTMTLKCSLTHHNIGASKQIVLEGVGLVQEKYPTLNGQGTGVVRRFKSSVNDHLFEDPNAQHIFINVSGLNRAAAIAFDATKKYDVVITESVEEPVATPITDSAAPESSDHTD
jgi:hypothetical protein